MGADLRAFIALSLPPELQQRVGELQSELAGRLPGGRWVKPEQLHLTLRFFPSLPEECLDRIRRIMLSIGDFCAPFAVRLEGFGAFPHLARPRVFWLGLEPADPIVQLQNRLDRTLREAGFEGDSRPFKPHLTVGRVKTPVAAAAPVAARFDRWSGGTWTVTQMILYRSDLTRSGAIHTSLHRAQLGGGEKNR